MNFSGLFSLLALALVLSGCGSGCGRGGDGGPLPAASSKSDALAPASASGPGPTHPWAAAARQQAIEAGKEVVARQQCNRCHTIDDIPAAARPLHCTGCHVFLKGVTPGDHQYEKLVEKYGAPVLERYQRNIKHLQQLPSLTAVARRLRPDWIGAFLASPFDVRPALDEGMQRNALGEGDVRALVRYFAAEAEAVDPYEAGYAAPALRPRPSAERVAQGKALFLERGCTACHTFGNLDTRVPAAQLLAAGASAALAPNLRFVRDRVRPEVLVDWIVDPQKISPGSPMVSLGLGRPDAEAIADFLVWGDPELAPAGAAPDLTPPPPAARPVSYEEMKERVLGKVCVHCHMNDYEKDPGPGNRGGFGYRGVQLQMRTYETLVSGAVDEKGQRYSVLAPRAGEPAAPIVLAMMRRRAEEPRDRVAPFHDHERPGYPKAPPGMPMGLPAMTDEEMGLLEAWINQGCPGPSKVSGVAGVSDGYLVPDGPIKKNQGCELRAPEALRPAWAAGSEPAKPAGR